MEPPEQAPGEPLPFTNCPDGACPREQPAYLFSGEFQEAVVDLRVASCGVGLDLIWARRYRSRLELPVDQTPLGNNWDHNYNIYLQLPSDDPRPSTLVVHDGNARPAAYVQTGETGRYESPGFHREGDFDEAGRFRLRFADGGQWVFKSAAESTRADVLRLAEIVDRNGNAIRLEYDREDRLERVVNAAGQHLQLEYDGSGHIVAVTAQLGDGVERRVTYERYGPGDPDGNEHDLARVTLPAIVGTVTGNDFPDGTATTYTYSTNTGRPELDGNLLTITDALGQTTLRNRYASTTDEGAFEFDRLLSQRLGESDEVTHIAYAAVEPREDNGEAVVTARVNDPLGRVSEHFFNARNQLVVLRQYTGFADPSPGDGGPADPLGNHPTGPLRESDPSYFETRYTYNADGHKIETVHPRGNVSRSVYEGDLDPSASPLVRGNLRETRREVGSCGDEPGDLVESFEYAPGRGNEHGATQFVVRAEDARGNVTLAEYDDAGNRIGVDYPEPGTREDLEYDHWGRLVRQLHPADADGRRREVEHRYEDGGRRRVTIEDPGGLALTTVLEFDVACNEVGRVEPDGAEHTYLYNARDQLVRELGPSVECASGCGQAQIGRTFTDRIYDANMNLVRVDYELRDCDRVSDGVPEVVATHYVHDALGELIETRQELGDGEDLVTQFELAPDREVVQIRYGEAVAGRDPHNTVRYVYDERGLLFAEIRGEGSDAQSSVRHDYDANGNEVATLAGLEGDPRLTSTRYDCADRPVGTVDPMGNRTVLELDQVGNQVEQRRYGELVDVAGDADNVLLERTVTTYDAMNRPVVTARAHFDPATGVSLDDGWSTTTTIYDGESRVVREIDDNGGETQHEYDLVGRRTSTVDPAGNRTELVYDNGGNVVEQIDTHVTSPVVWNGSEERTRVWRYAYDSTGESIATTDPVGNQTQTCLDSLGRETTEIDARGNRVRHVYDGAGRLLESHHILTDDGTGAGTAIGEAVVRQIWDASDRLVAQEDPNGNVARYTHDSLGRVTEERFADGSAVVNGYDPHDNLVSSQDPNGTVLVHGYDGLDRLVAVGITPGESVDADITWEAYGFDGRSLLVSASNDASEVVRAHDSLGGLLEERQTVHVPDLTRSGTIHYRRDGLGNPTQTRYPDGRKLDRRFDPLGRTRLLTESPDHRVLFDYLGPDLQRRTVEPLGLVSEYVYDDDRRMTGSTHTLEHQVLDERRYGYDEADNKRTTVGLPPSVAGEQLVTHDSLDRATRSEVVGSSVGDRDVAYTLDGAGNRMSVVGDRCPGEYQQRSGAARVHQYSSTPCEAWTHDANGNLVESRSRGDLGRSLLLGYDHRDRLVSYSHVGVPEQRFVYDALGRKILAGPPSNPERIVHLVYDGWNVVEEYVGEADRPAASYLYVSEDLDQRLELRRDESWWYIDDETGSAIGLVGSPANDEDIEWYVYDDYGVPQILRAGELQPQSIADNPYLFAGMRYIPDARLYDARTRHYDPVAGRFISRDSIGVWGDEENLGNGYTYVGNSPQTYTDPTGEAKKPHVKNCHTGAQTQVYESMLIGQRLANQGKRWFKRQGASLRGRRQRDWNRRAHDARLWWGTYKATRFRLMKNNYRKAYRRIAKNVIRFKCRSTGICRPNGTSAAWTHSTWHGVVRLCKKPIGGFYMMNGAMGDKLPPSGSLLFHEVAHNINAIGDKKMNGDKAYSESETQKLARIEPHRACWNAANYENYVYSRVY